MTTRPWMVTVAALALAMGGLVGVRAVWQYFVALDRVQYHEGMEAMWRWLGRDLSKAESEQPPTTDDAGLNEAMRAVSDQYQWIVASLHRQAECHAALARKYRRVARLPWLPVEPDPPEPVP
jgi:hypothetical protein